MFPMQMNTVSNMTGMKPGKRKRPRGGRGGKNKHKAVNAHHAQAQEHLGKAMAAPTPQAAHGHLFKALTALNKAKAGPPMPSAGAAPATQPMMPPAGPSGAMPNG